MRVSVASLWNPDSVALKSRCGALLPRLRTLPVDHGAFLEVGEALAFARGRMTFGKRLVEHQVMQHKIAEMMRVSEASMAFLEQAPRVGAHHVE